MPDMNVVDDNSMAMVANICCGEGTSIFDFYLTWKSAPPKSQIQMKLPTAQ